MTLTGKGRWDRRRWDQRLDRGTLEGSPSPANSPTARMALGLGSKPEEARDPIGYTSRGGPNKACAGWQEPDQ